MRSFSPSKKWDGNTQKAKDALYQTRLFCKNAKLASKWVMRLDKRPHHLERAHRSSKILGEFNDLHHAAFASDALFRQLGESTNALTTATAQGVSLMSRAKRLAGSLVNFFVNSTTLLLFANNKKIFNLTQKGYNYAPSVALVGSASLLCLQGASLAKKGEKVVKAEKKFTFVKIADLLCALKAVIFNTADLVAKPISPGAAITLDTMSSCYSIGKAVVQEGRADAGVRKAKAQCRVLGMV